MNLFRQDYMSLSDKHIDYGTNNKSFLRMYSVLKKMGIQNNKFFLTILDTDLIGVDPHNLKDDSLELKLRIAREAKLNPWYYFRAILRIPESGSDGSMFRLSRANLAMIWLYFNHIDNLLVMPRQLGKTIGSISITSAVVFVIGSNITFALLTKDDALRKENVERLKNIRDSLPDWFIHKQRLDTNNTEGISYNALNNKYITFVAQQSDRGADRLGRGMTVPSQHWDEPAFFPNIDITYPVAISTTNAAIESAKANNQPYGNILTTTAGALNTEEGEFTHRLICNSLPFTEHLYDLPNNEELLKIVKANSPQGMVFCEFNYRQLGKTDEWFQEKAARTAGDDDKIANDYLNTWTFGTGKKHPLEKKTLDTLNKHKKEPMYIQYIDEFMIKWYIPESVVKIKSEFSKIPIAVGMDASENVGRDFTSFVFTDARNASVIGTCMCNTTNVIKVASLIAKLLVDYSNIVYIPERNSVGCAIVDYCLLKLEQNNINPFFRIYNEVIQDFDNRKMTRAELFKPGLCNEYRNSFGFRTSGASRPFLYKTVFKHVVDLACDRVNDITLINQIGGLTIKNGRIDHGSGGNDDSVIAYILCGYLLFFGNNLHMYDFSGGDVDTILHDLPISGNGSENNIDISEITNIKEKIDVLGKRARGELNPTTRVELLQDIQKLKNSLPNNADDVLITTNTLHQLKHRPTTIIGNDIFEKSMYLSNYLNGL